MRRLQTVTELASPFDPSTNLEALSRGRPDIACRPASTNLEKTICAQLRHEVFVVEQEIFAETDLDAHDREAHTIHLVADVAGVAGGTVRIYPLDRAGLWKGDRLAVAPALRRMVVGKRLVQTAVRTAGELGGVEMIATVQVPNTRFFEHLGWRCDGGPTLSYDLPHQLMRIDLTR